MLLQLSNLLLMKLMFMGDLHIPVFHAPRCMHPPPHLWDPGSGAGNGNPICNSAGLLWDAVPLRMGSILHFSRLWVGSCGG